MGLEASLDFETRCDVDLKVHGAARYFASNHFRPLILCYSIDGGGVQTWLWGEPVPVDLDRHIRSGGLIRAYNASFERQCLNWLYRNCNWPEVKLEQYRCTAAEAAAMGLPRRLSRAAQALGLPEQKDDGGAALIRFFSNPIKKLEAVPRFRDPADHPDRFEEFINYCRQDVRTEMALSKRVARLSDYEQEIYFLDQKINDRGVRIDRVSALAAIKLVATANDRLNQKLQAVTGGAVSACSEVSKLTNWLLGQGVEIDGLAKDQVLSVLDCNDISSEARQALELRQDAAKTSTTKIKAFLNRASSDGRVRGAFLYHAASTGRWSSIGVNFANLPRPRREFDEANLDLASLFEAFRSCDPDWLETLYGQKLGRPLYLVSDAIRGFVWSAPGHDLISADYSGIEGAVIAWLADEKWKLEAMRDIIADPSKPDMYRVTAAAIMGTTTDVVTKKHPLRQSVGKVSELALGFGGGVSAFVAMAKGYGVDLDSLYVPVWGAAEQVMRDRVTRRYNRLLKSSNKAKTDVLSREAWLACEIIKNGWREKNSAIAALWSDLEAAMRDAIDRPGEQFTAGKCTYLVKNNFLWCRLPSGRCLAYGSPKLVDQVWVKLGDAEESEIMDRREAEKLAQAGEASIEGDATPSISALGVNAISGRYERFNLYGGLASENVTQATARDILAHGMQTVERHGYPIVAHVYDEVVCEVPADFGDLADFERILCQLPDWATGLPLTASGWRGKRYRK